MRAPARSALVLALASAAALLEAPGARAEEARHWAWTPPVRPAPPPVKDSAWARSPLDAFILAGIEAAGLRPAPPATREQWIRRATLDLTGLPPTPGEVAAFVGDSSPGAWERVVDRLLDSPGYGERWGRNWLDLVRFAESNGYEHDEVRPDAWRYRDYVIRSLNADKPYDRFIEEQLAGDELYPEDPEALVATGFNLLGPDMTDASDKAERRQNTLNDMTDTTGLVFLGLTMGCARCHDHKFEPILALDYYRMQAFFAPSEFRSDLPIARAPEREAHARAAAEHDALIRPLEEEIARVEEPYRRVLHEARLQNLSEEAQAAHQTPEGRRTAAQRELVEKTQRLLTVSPEDVLKRLTPEDRARRDEIAEKLKPLLAKRPPPLPVALGLRDAPGPPPRTFLYERGDLRRPAGEVEPGFPAFLLTHSRAQSPPVAPGRRAALARWIRSRENPLTARVLVNRIWQHHFGRGIVPTPSDFGLRGEPPTHPGLLDWLAVELMEGGWRMKRLHRAILSSAAYRQSSACPAETLARDPENRLFSRMKRRRMEAETVRDSLLAISGRLDGTMGGPGAPPGPGQPRRRSIYLFQRRNLRVPFLETFDLPDSNLSCPGRERSTTALQALSLLNDAEVMEAARALAARLESEGATEEERVVLAYRLALGRRPSPEEARLAREFLLRSPLSELGRALVNLNEFVYIE